MTTSDDVVNLIVAALVNATDAEDRVFNPRTWPTKPDLFPILLIQSPSEHKASKGKNAPAYDVFTTVRVIARTNALAQDGDAAAAMVLDALGALQRQIEVAVINNYALYLQISEIASVDVRNEVKSEGGQTLGELTMDFQCEFYQGTEMFAPAQTVDITEFALVGDLSNVFDPNGIYEPVFPYEPTAPPRLCGPDGRPEVAAVLFLQEYDRVTNTGDGRITNRGATRSANLVLTGD